MASLIILGVGLATAPGVCAQIGIASRYPSDKNIGSDPEVILADDFESYTSVSQMIGPKWTNVQHTEYVSLDSTPGNFFGGTKAVKISLPISGTEVGSSLVKKLGANSVDTIFVRIYEKWDANYSVNGSNHNGIHISGGTLPGPGIPAPADGTGFFIFTLQNNMQGRAGEVDPGYDHVYAYWPKQNSQYGDHWFPDGVVIPSPSQWLTYPSQYPDFKPMPNHLPQRGKWYCYEMMLHANTPGKNDGELKWWVDGKLIADLPDLNIRSISSLKIDEPAVVLGANNPTTPLTKWYDNVVMATQYIGPMATASPSPTPTPTPVTNQTLANISTRGVVQTGNGVLIGGFILKGNASNEVLMRGLGPSLSAFGVANVLSNPLIELHDSTGALIGSNDGWKRDFNHNAIPVTLQPSNDSECALDRTLSPGSYTVILKGAQGQTGVGLFELYEISGEGSIVQNISTRGVVQTGDDMMIGGFVLRGTIGHNQRVIVRAIGPSLGRFGVTGCLANPSLRIFNSDGVMIGQNDNWGDSQAAEITQTLLAPLDPLESAIILNLPTGSYTAVVSGVGGNTGNALMEVYLLP